MAIFTAIAAAVAAVATAVGVTATVGGIAVASIIGYTVATAVTVGLVFGGIALSKSASGSFDYQSPVSSSPTYGSGVIQTQTNNNLPIPLIYGNVKCAGNLIWQNDSGESTIKRLVSFGWGEIGGYSDIKLNDNDIETTTDSFYSYTTNLLGDNNDLFFVQHLPQTEAIVKITYVDPGTGNPSASIDVTKSGIDYSIIITLANPSGTITTTANDIIALVNNNATIRGTTQEIIQKNGIITTITKYTTRLLTVYNAEGNDGSGIVTAMSQKTIPIYNYTEGTYSQEFYGRSDQHVSELIPGDTNAERAEVVGGLKNIAYLAVVARKSDKVDINYNLTALVQGLKVNQYTDEDTYTNAFSNNTAWCLLDLLTNYNGLGLGRDENNDFDNDLLKEIVDIQSFITAAEYCDDEIGYYAKTTALMGDNNDLIWQGRASGDNGITITYADPGTGHATASIAVDVDNNITVTLANPSGTITTTANDIIDLVNNNSDISALVRVMSADDNDGTGVVTAMTQQALTLDEAVTRYTFNMIFDSKFSIRDAVEEFKLNCNGAFVIKDGKLQFKIDKPETSKQTFTTKDIKKGTLKEWFEPRGDRYDVLKVEYIDPEYDYSKVEAHIERTTPFNTPIIDHKIQCYSVNSFFHASRLGKLYMLRSELCSRFISFTTGYQAVGRQIGDVITLTYEKGNTTIFDAKLFKIYMMVDNQKGELEIYCREYDERIYSDELGSLEPVVNTIVINPQEKLRAATFVIASPDSLNKEQADYICDNAIGADVAIQSVIDNLPLQVLETGTAQTGSTASNIILDGESQRAVYNSLYIRFTTGDCASEDYKIIDSYALDTNAVTVATAFTGTPTEGDTYEILQVAGEILLLEGNYELSGFVTIRPGVILGGLGNGTVISFNKDGGFIYEDENAGIIDIKLYDLRVNQVLSSPVANVPIITCGNFANNIQFDNISGIIMDITYINNGGVASNVLLKNSRIVANNETQINIYDGSEIINNYITGRKVSGTYAIFHCDTTMRENVVFKNNFFKNVLEGFCTNMYLKNSSVTGNIFHNIGIPSGASSCIMLDGDNIDISNNSGIECTRSLLFLGSIVNLNNCQIYGNSAINCATRDDGAGNITAAFLFVDTHYCNIQNNTARAKSGSAPDYGMAALASTYNVISNNDLKGSVSYGTASLYINNLTGNVQNNNRT